MQRLLVILDLDETLVHVPDHALSRRADFEVLGHAGYARPHLEPFLRELAARYDVAVWTAADADYARAVVAAVVPPDVELAFMWSADRCTAHFNHETRDHSTIKKVRKVEVLGYDLARVVMVDDSPEKHFPRLTRGTFESKNYGNLLPIAPFLGDRADAELPAALAFIHALAEHADVRPIEKRFWRTA